VTGSLPDRPDPVELLDTQAAFASRSSCRSATLGCWYHRSTFFRGRRRTERFEQNVVKARSKDSLKAFAKLTEIVDGELRIITDAPLIIPIEEVIPAAEHHRVDKLVRGVIRSYRRSLETDRRRPLDRYHHVHLARK
jgi:hypothetical protein